MTAGGKRKCCAVGRALTGVSCITEAIPNLVHESVLGTQMGSKMLRGNEYRVRARECMEAADRLNDPGRRFVLLELAQRWLMLANKIDEIEARRQPTGDAPLDQPGSSETLGT